MHCSRCHGLMLKDHFLDMEGAFGEMWAQSWRCMNCGAVHDAVIEQASFGTTGESLGHW